jgi:transposase-like protein
MPRKNQRRPGSKPIGTPPKYNPKTHPEEAMNMALLRLDDSEIAHVFGITEKTLYQWKTKHPEFGEALLDGKEKADGKVVRSYYKMTVGYEYTDYERHTVKKKTIVDGKEVEIEEVVDVPVKKFMPPSPSAAKTWLSNRHRSRWGKEDQPTLQQSVTNNTTVNVLSTGAGHETRGMNHEELEAIRRVMIASKERREQEGTSNG